MPAQSRIRLIAGAITALAMVMIFFSWARGGFGINTSTYQDYPDLRTAQQKFGCYKNANLIVKISKYGLSFPNSNVSITKSIFAEDKHGQLIYFEPAINVASDSKSGWVVYRDDKNQMISKIYFLGDTDDASLKIPWLTEDGIVLHKLSSC